MDQVEFTVIFCTYQEDGETKTIVNRMAKAIEAQITEKRLPIKYSYSSTDVSSFQPPTVANAAATFLLPFGETAHRAIADCAGFVYPLPAQKLLLGKDDAYKLKASDVLVNIVAHMQKIITVKTKSVAVVESPKPITIAKQDADINITDQEIDYILKLKQLLGQGLKRIIITKGDLKIEVEQ